MLYTRAHTQNTNNKAIYKQRAKRKQIFYVKIFAFQRLSQYFVLLWCCFVFPFKKFNLSSLNLCKVYVFSVNLFMKRVCNNYEFIRGKLKMACVVCRWIILYYETNMRVLKMPTPHKVNWFFIWIHKVTKFVCGK